MFFFVNDTATTEIYTLSLHDALPIWLPARVDPRLGPGGGLLDAQLGDAVVDGLRHAAVLGDLLDVRPGADRKSTRLNSSHANISYAVFCLKKKKPEKQIAR